MPEMQDTLLLRMRKSGWFDLLLLFLSISIVLGGLGIAGMIQYNVQMNNMAELITVQKYWRQWSDPRFVVLVLNNEDLNQVTWEQRAMEGNPKYEATQVIPDVPYHQFARLIGLEGIYCDDPGQVGDVWDQALAAQRPVVVEMKTDPEVPPLPPHISLDQMRAFMSTIVKGDPDQGSMLKKTARQVLSSVLPGD